jgi:CDP-4-dehydro-6-deoxyglucose reductase
MTLAKAARLLGVSRTALQADIRSGRITTFEGQIKVSELLRAYPDVGLERSAMVERVEHIKQHAKARRNTSILPDTEARLRERLDIAQRQLSNASVQASWYGETLDELVIKLTELEKCCEEADRVRIAALISWLFYKIDN